MEQPVTSEGRASAVFPEGIDRVVVAPQGDEDVTCVLGDAWCVSRGSYHSSSTGVFADAETFRRAVSELQVGHVSRTDGPHRPWAKALGAIVLALLAAIVITFTVANSQEADRERAAFEDTRLDAERLRTSSKHGNSPRRLTART
ncbi:hypothetical protein STRCI_008184 [Streptomyces cinnabarinus]|uniref:Uncharacterized protein n=1 Tax=Streptomyces cinnabarinus TaxID=67287 RepID=A0ABY7KSJ0_9ACTN|nr:hypothetical protein [Streptomyces cinnabarinus]WAZ26590.1 hypothetical protein STRCI_008184 [Streptomyces cinnabarinus]